MARKTKKSPSTVSRKAARPQRAAQSPKPKRPAPAPRAKEPSEAPRIYHPGSSLDWAKSLVRDIPDFPKAGIVFKDITTLLAVPRAFHIVLDSLAERLIGESIDAIVGIEARGFIFGGALAARLNAGFIPARKPGKLPARLDRVLYDTEYSQAQLEMHIDAIQEGARVVVVDDVLATGGTAAATAELVRRQGGHVVAFAFAIELTLLNGRERLVPIRIESAITY